ncbi:OmpA family protein [Streptomyces anandii]|uniref:OmpA family protein n=1 Tax=Streptomyces anandii TaxID=285454 RepID=UPI0036FFB4CD
MTITRSRITAPFFALAVAASVLAGGADGKAAAIPAPRSAASGTHALLAVDAGSPGLALRAGATLAPPKVLNLSAEAVGVGQVVEDQQGAERREDTGAQVTFALQAKVLFAKDSAQLSNAARFRIAAVARRIDPRPGTEVRIYGFTDDLGSSAHGDALSRQRAIAVQGVVAEELHGAAVTFDTRGFGERDPVASNVTEAGREKNRRVEISFVPTAGSGSSFDPVNAP